MRQLRASLREHLGKLPAHVCMPLPSTWRRCSSVGGGRTLLRGGRSRLCCCPTFNRRRTFTSFVPRRLLLARRFLLVGVLVGGRGRRAVVRCVLAC